MTTLSSLVFTKEPLCPASLFGRQRRGGLVWHADAGAVCTTWRNDFGVACAGCGWAVARAGFGGSEWSCEPRPGGLYAGDCAVCGGGFAEAPLRDGSVQRPGAGAAAAHEAGPRGDGGHS